MGRGEPKTDAPKEKTSATAGGSIARQMRARHSGERRPASVSSGTLLHTGSTLFNLALSDNPEGGYALGKMVNLIGDSSSGKTFFALSCFAEAARDERFDDYRLIYDDAEAANEFDMQYLFGKQTAKRVESPNEGADEPNSSTIQDFQDNILRAIKDGRPFIYVLDSFDALSSEEEEARSEKNAKLRESGSDKMENSYGMEKAKLSGQILRQIIRKLDQTSSILIIISQTRDNINPMSFAKKTRSGGRALKFYAMHEVWMAIGKEHKKTERKLTIGVDAEIKVTKNKLTGKRREISVGIYYDYGIDDIGSCIDFLLEVGYWEKKKLTIIATDLDMEATRDKLIRMIEDENRVDDLRECVGRAWRKIEADLRLGRKPKYADEDDNDDDNYNEEDDK